MFVECLGKGAPLVFFEVRMNGEGEEPSAMVIDPNGDPAQGGRPSGVHYKWHEFLRPFFGDIKYTIASTNHINRGDAGSKDQDCLLYTSDAADE